ncbi:zincin-like metallopeptidase domain-containing protein [Methylorubrum extorquens]|uniref:zincin-like metallopeptidase domain-containing protein n=1 Tax=Methylorubrum extorquens TaxID=408 RepID=UPI0032E7F69B
MPPRERFLTAQGYASTMAHELTHWSGAKGRLDRDLSGRFKSQAYAAEELVAELGSAFLMAEMGLEAEPHPIYASYLASWLKLLRSDSKAIFTAASAASRAAGYPSMDLALYLPTIAAPVPLVEVLPIVAEAHRDMEPKLQRAWLHAMEKWAWEVGYWDARAKAAAIREAEAAARAAAAVALAGLR